MPKESRTSKDYNKDLVTTKPNRMFSIDFQTQSKRPEFQITGGAKAHEARFNYFDCCQVNNSTKHIKKRDFDFN